MKRSVTGKQITAISLHGGELTRTIIHEAARRKDMSTGEFVLKAAIAFMGQAQYDELIAFFSGSRNIKYEETTEPEQAVV